MEQTKAQKVKQLLEKEGLSDNVKQSIKDKAKIINDNKTVNK